MSESRLVILAVLLAACQSAAPSADTVIFAPTWTGDSSAPTAAGIAISGDTILFVGDSASVAERIGDATEVIHAPDGLLLPGFNDGHVHFSDGGFQLGLVDLRDAATPAEFASRIKAFAANLPTGQWIVGGTWDHELWPGSPLPDRGWIDSITPDHPVFVQRLDGHMGLANSRALQLAGISAATSEIPGGTIIRDAMGEPTGLLKDEAMGPVFAVIPPPTPEQADTAVARAMRYANSKGLTAVSAVSAPWYEIAATRRIRAAGQQSLRISFYPLLGDWRRVADTLATNGPGDEWIRLAGVKGFVDGSLGSTTALFFDPYLDEPGSHGLMVTPEDSLRRWIAAADSAGLQVIVHAIGDHANKLLVDILDSVANVNGSRDRRFRIEHAQHLRPEEISRLRASAVIASMQPYHAADDGRWAAKRIRPPQLAGTYAFRSLFDAGARMIFGSDWVVAPLDPILGIWAAVDRTTIDGANPGGWYPGERISVETALTAYTTNGAFGVFADSSRGILKAGMLADVVLLDRDIRTVPSSALDDAKVRLTMVGGKVVYRQ